MEKRLCCCIPNQQLDGQCQNLAEYQIWMGYSPTPDGYTESCADHLEEMLDDSGRFEVIRIVDDEIREQLAAYAHEAWSGWMKYMFSKCTRNPDNFDGSAVIPASLVERWTLQMNTPYSELPEEMKPSDRDEADKMLAILGA